MDTWQVYPTNSKIWGSQWGVLRQAGPGMGADGSKDEEEGVGSGKAHDSLRGTGLQSGTSDSVDGSVSCQELWFSGI